MNTFEVHPAAAKLPLIEGDEFDELVASIKNGGLDNPIVLAKDGRLLDGRNRLRACKAAGVEPEYETYQGDDLVHFVVRQNIHRRHLTVGQQAAFASDIAPDFAEETRIRQLANLKQNVKNEDQGSLVSISSPVRPDSDKRRPTGRTSGIGDAAKAIGVNRQRVSQFQRIERTAPELATRVRNGLPLDNAEKQLKRRIAQTSETEARVIKLDTLTPDASGKGWRLLLGEFQERLAELADESVDAIITDPPYPAEFLPLWSDLSKHAARVLKPQGLVIALTGQIYLPEVMARLGEHLSYGWAYCQPMPGQNSRIMGRHLFQTWKPWLVYSNGAWPSGLVDWHEDTTDPSKMSKSYRWEQGGDPAVYLLDNLTHDGAVVLDPFTGTGTYGEIAIRMGREFVGVEADGERFGNAAERLGRANA